MTLPTIPLCELGKIVSGSTPKTGVPKYWNGDIPWITPADLSSHTGIYFHGTPKKISKAGYESCSTAMLPAGSILFSSRAPIGHCALTAYPVCTNQGFKSVVPNERLDPLYGYFALKFLTPAIVSMGRGATFAEISKDLIESVQVPYCDLPDQRRIAAQLEQADRLVHTRRYALELTDALLPATFIDLFGNFDREPNRWSRIQFDSVCKISKDTVDPRHPSYADLPQISSEDIESVTGELGSLKTARQKGVISVNFLVQSDELLFSKIRPKLRKVAQPGLKALCSADIYPIRLVNPNCQLTYLLFYLRSDYFSRIVTRLAEARSNIPKVNRDELSEQTIPLPPLPLQQKFAALVERVRARRAVQREGLRQAEHLFASLLHRAFSN